MGAADLFGSAHGIGNQAQSDLAKHPKLCIGGGVVLTQEAVKNLGAHIIDHDNMGPGIRMANGVIKTGHGLIIPPSDEQDDTGNAQSEETKVEQDAEIPVLAETPTKERKRGKKQAAKEPVREPVNESKTVRVDVEVAGFGTIPTQYAHMYPGKGILVLGLTDLSFVPAESTSESLCLVGFSNIADRKYAYCGNRFVDGAGKTNVVMIEMEV